MNDLIIQLQMFLFEHLDLVQIKLIVSYTLINLICGISAGIKNGDFQLAKVGEFLYKKLLPYTLVYIGASLFGEIIGFTGLTSIAFSGIIATLTGDFLDSLRRLGLEFIPPILTKTTTQIQNAASHENILLTAEPINLIKE